MWKPIFLRLVAVAALVTVCSGARMAPQPLQTTTTTLPPAPSMSPVPLTILQEQPTPPSPPVCADATDVTNPLGRLRSAMRNPAYTQMNAFFDAFIIFYTDEHLSEEPLMPERRLQYISGWDGAGTGAVLADGGAAVWVPSGDVRRARSLLTCAWLVIDADDPSQPTITEWVSERIARSGRVGGDARLTSVGEWQVLSAALQREGLQLVHIPTLVDQLWSEEPDPELRRPDFPKTVAKNYEIQFAGVAWREKVALVRNELRAVGADAMIVTALDEVAWLLNVRGKDLPYARLLKAFVVVSQREVKIYVPPGKLSVHVRDALAVFNCITTNCTKVNDYINIYSDLRRSIEPKILIPAAGTFQRGASAAIAQSVPHAKRMFLLSPIIYLKAQKNEAEVKGMKKAHIRDAVAMCTLLSYLETKSAQTELSVERTTDITRETQAGYIGPSMKTRVAYAANAADPDYRATNASNKVIFKNATLVIQSGGQYDEGTTVVTRTVHYGPPSRDERRAYTTVLRALAALAGLRAPGALPAAHADPVVRAPLWAAKQDYPHPTGHGVGAALSRKEDPVVIDYRQDTNLHTLKEGYFITAEPGWYETGKYGVRLGNILEVVSRPNGYLGFHEATLIPYEPKLIDRSMLTEYEINWLNGYNDRIRKEVGPELKSRGQMDVYYWMMNKTVPLELPSKVKKVVNNSAASLDNLTTILPAMAMIHVPPTPLQEQPTPPSPPVCADATDVTNPLGRLRSAMRNPAYTQMNASFDAFIIFYTDEHLSEEPLMPERRLQYISGWDGAGTGAVLADGGAAVWVPSGDVRRARSLLTCAWLVIDADDPSQPTITEWVSERIARSGRVGGDARLTSVGEWQILSAALQREGLQLVHIPTLVDQIWSEEPDPELRRPDFPKMVAKNYDIQLAGVAWREKVAMVRNELRAVGADAMIVTALDEVAWLLNVRGKDLPYARLLKAFVVVSQREVKIYVPPRKLSVHVRDALAVFNCITTNCTKVRDYTDIYADIRQFTESKILIPAASTFQRGASAAIAQSVPRAKRMFLLSPIIYLKAQKNEAEVKGMRKAHIRDAVAMCTLLSYLEKLQTKSAQTELSVERTTDITRETQAGYIEPSMKTRVAYAANAADPDYRATNASNKVIFKNATLVIQSGGQYDEGTTVVTRTVHYGPPSRDERRAYTTVLRALAALAGLRAPGALPAAHADPVVRAPLWAAKQDYPHPTGHGVGAALSRKEDPVVIDYRQEYNMHTFKEGYFITAEPGWYETGKYGVRLGNILEVVSRTKSYLGFHEATLIPYEPKLIDSSMLTQYEINWLNGYNDRIRKEVGPELKSRGQMDVYYWMMNKTVPFELPSMA